MAVVQWIGIGLSAIGLIWTGYKEYPNIKYQLSPQVESRFLYTNMIVAYDVNTGKHWFFHPDGVWREFPFAPKL